MRSQPAGTDGASSKPRCSLYRVILANSLVKVLIRSTGGAGEPPGARVIANMNSIMLLLFDLVERRGGADGAPLRARLALRLLGPFMSSAIPLDVAGANP